MNRWCATFVRKRPPLFFLSMNTREMSKSHIAKMPEKKTTLGDSWFAWFLPLMKRARQGSTVRNGTGFSFYLIENFSLAHPAHNACDSLGHGEFLLLFCWQYE